MTWSLSFGALATLVIAGYLLLLYQSPRKVLFAWIFVVSTALFSTLAFTTTSAPIRMFIIVTLQLVAMKVLVVANAYEKRGGISFPSWVAFALGWFGMRPQPFEKKSLTPLPYASFLVRGSVAVVAGIAILHDSQILERTDTEIIFRLFLLTSFSLILHFGVLNIVTGLWRRAGVNVSSLFRSPYKSGSLKEFWGGRWNVAFAEMTSLVIYRPLKAAAGTRVASMASFLFSGLLHDLAISVPAGGGYGGPTLYFIIQGLAMDVEQRAAWLTNRPIVVRIWVGLILFLPLPLLFHRRFASEILIPIRDSICL